MHKDREAFVWDLLHKNKKDLEKQRKAEEKQAQVEERRQLLILHKAEKEAEAKAAATKRKQRWRQSPAFAKIKADASKVLAKLASPKVGIEQYMQRGEWASVPQFMKLRAENYLQELTAMYDEAKGKFSDREPEPFSFDMAMLNKIVSDGKSIQKTFKEFRRDDKA